MSDLPRTLFIARGGAPAVTWYRCALPATVLGCDWISVKGEPADGRVRAGSTHVDFTLDEVAGYDVAIVQQLSGPHWLKQIREWQAAGVTVLYEIDDWLHGVRGLGHHAHADKFDRASVEAHELCMRAADGIICSTDWLARRYRGINPRTWTCRNGIDLVRYEFSRPERDHVGIGWAGGTGHAAAVKPWMDQVAAVMRDVPATTFTSVGQPFAHWLEPEFGVRALSLPFAGLEAYPAAMRHFDIALAPAGKGDFFKGKSDLRWLEAAALAMPCIADPEVYPDIEHGVTGFHAATPQEAGAILRELVADADLRERVGTAAYEHVVAHRRAQVTSLRWAEVLREAVREPVAA